MKSTLNFNFPMVLTSPHSSELKWPNRCKCLNETVDWSMPNLNKGASIAIPYSFCPVCGTMHPKDFYRQLRTGKIHLELKYWENTFPTLFMVIGIKNPKFGRNILLGKKEDKRNGSILDGKLKVSENKHLSGKWRIEHFLDLDPETFDNIVMLMKRVKQVDWDDLRFRPLDNLETFTNFYHSHQWG